MEPPLFFPPLFLSLSCNHGETRRVKNVNIELPHSARCDGAEISAVAIHFVKQPSSSKQRVTKRPQSRSHVRSSTHRITASIFLNSHLYVLIPFVIYVH